MPWLLSSPGHQQPWYWPCRICRSWSYLRKDFKYLCHINVEYWHKMFMFPLKNLARKELLSSISCWHYLQCSWLIILLTHRMPAEIAWGRLNIKMMFDQNRNSCYEDKTVLWSFSHFNGNPYTWKNSLYIESWSTVSESRALMSELNQFRNPLYSTPQELCTWFHWLSGKL